MNDNIEFTLKYSKTVIEELLSVILSGEGCDIDSCKDCLTQIQEALEDLQ